MKRILFFQLCFLFTGFSSVFAQGQAPVIQKEEKPKQVTTPTETKPIEQPKVEPKPDQSTTDALSTILVAPKQEKVEKYEYTDRGSIQKNIKSVFFNWSQKGEFEKQADYEVRIKKQSQSKFTEICIEEIKKKINSFRSSDLSINLLTYDAENEFFPTVFKFKGREWKNQVKISIDKAQNFKENEWRKFHWQKEESIWCLINNELFPSKIYLKRNSHYITFNLPLPNQEEITVSFNDLGIENPYLKDFIFNYSTALGKESNIYSPDGDPNASSYYGIRKGLDGDGNYLLGGRKAIVKKIIVQDCNQEGTVVVDIDVDRSGNVTKAIPGGKGTTTNSKCLLDPARRAALETKFNSDPNAPESQIGRIIYRFSLSE